MVIVLEVVVDNVRSLGVVAAMKSRMLAVVVDNVRNLRCWQWWLMMLKIYGVGSGVGCGERIKNNLRIIIYSIIKRK